jgi:hypothetical protein
MRQQRSQMVEAAGQSATFQNLRMNNLAVSIATQGTKEEATQGLEYSIGNESATSIYNQGFKSSWEQCQHGPMFLCPISVYSAHQLMLQRLTLTMLA